MAGEGARLKLHQFRLQISIFNVERHWTLSVCLKVQTAIYVVNVSGNMLLIV